MRTARLALAIGCLTAAGALAACSSGTSLLTTGSNKAGASTPQPPTPKERAMHAAMTAAEAGKCGYNVDSAKLRAGYLAWEGSQGLEAKDVAALEQVYDTTRSRVATGITKPDDYCTDERTEVIKKHLGKQLAGDFSAPPKKPEVPWLTSGPSSNKMDREKVFNPQAIR